MITTVIGRGHSGTSAIGKTLHKSGLWMGGRHNEAWDLIPADKMYKACRLLAEHVVWNGGLSWDWSALHEGEIPGEFVGLVGKYLRPVLNGDAEHKGWKLPETILVLPWMVRLYPEIRYIYWIRDPRDVITGRHKMTDDLKDMGIAYPKTKSLRERRAISWLYQYDIVQATPKPEHWIEVRYEDFCLKQEETLERLEDFLGLELARIPVHTDAIGRYKTAEGETDFDFFAPALDAYGYEREGQ